MALPSSTQGFTPVRKPGKLPGECIETSFKKEYGEDKFEMQTAGIERGQNVLVRTASAPFFFLFEACCWGSPRCTPSHRSWTT